jgi:hypothetical protein
LFLSIIYLECFQNYSRWKDECIVALQHVIEEGRSLLDGESGWVFRALALSESLDKELTAQDALSEVAARLRAVAVDSGCTLVAGASPTGERLAGAVVAGSEGALRLWSGAPESECILFLDGSVATGIQLVDAIRRAEHSGAPHAIGAAVIARRAALDQWRGSGVSLVALEVI